MNTVDLYLSLGSNLGDRESNIAQATMALSINFEISDIQSSSYYDSEPLYNIDQPHFLNSVVKCKTSLKPFEVLDVIKKVERMLGRKDRREKRREICPFSLFLSAKVNMSEWEESTRI